MTTRIARMYATAAAANAAVAALRAQGFATSAIAVIGPAAAQARQANIGVEAATALIMAAYIPMAEAKVYAEGVARGRTLVIVRAAWGFAVKAQRTLAGFSPVETGVAEPHDPARAWDDNCPLSSTLGVKVLSSAATPASDMFSLPLLSKAATPLSDALHLGALASGAITLSRALGLPTLLRSGRCVSDVIGLPAVSRGARVLSEVIGLPTRVERVGIPKVVKNGRPLSEALGLPTVSKRGRAVSEALGIPTLTKRGRGVTETMGMPMLVRQRSASA